MGPSSYEFVVSFTSYSYIFIVESRVLPFTALTMANFEPSGDNFVNIPNASLFVVLSLVVVSYLSNVAPFCTHVLVLVS